MGEHKLNKKNDRKIKLKKFLENHREGLITTVFLFITAVIFILICMAGMVFDGYYDDVVSNNVKIICTIIAQSSIFMLFGYPIILRILFVSGGVISRVYKKNDCTKFPWIKTAHFMAKYKKLCGVELDSNDKIYIAFLYTLNDILNSCNTDKVIKILKRYENIYRIKKIISFTIEHYNKSISKKMERSLNRLSLQDVSDIECNIDIDTVVNILEDLEKMFPDYKLKTVDNELTTYKHQPYTDFNGVSKLLGYISIKL